MKKNKMMRIASFLLVAVLMSTCAISGTFAKYVTSDTATDSARVAKWGITMDATGTATFKTEYDSSVQSDASDKVVAPGTSNSETIEVDGKPETDYFISFSYDASSVKDIYLGATKYTYTTEYETPKTTTLANDYYPVEYKVTIATTNGKVEETETDGGFTDSKKERAFASVAAALTALSKTTITFDAGETCDLVVTIAWEWDFDTTKPGTITENTYGSDDLNDTILGDLIWSEKNPGSAIVSADTSKYSTTIAYNLTITATQID